MHIRHKILMGVFALALPMGTMVGLSPAAFAKVVPNPVHCTGFSGTVTFGTPLATEGVLTTSKTAINTTITGSSFTCSGGIAPNTGGPSNDGASLTVTGAKNVKNSDYSKSACKLAPTNPTVCDKYVTGTWGEFVASAATFKKSLKTINFSIAGHLEVFKNKGASLVLFGVCGGGVGFTLSGQVKAAPYADKTASVTACLSTDSGVGFPDSTATGNFGGDYNTADGVVTAQIDPSLSVATL
jgi:hypothetical protein